MAKTLSLDSKDLAPARNQPLSASRQRGVVASAEYVPMQFKLPPDFVKSFKQAALDNDMKLNELLIACFKEFIKSNNNAASTM
jgi:hypothetical protein